MARAYVSTGWINHQLEYHSFLEANIIPSDCTRYSRIVIACFGWVIDLICQLILNLEANERKGLGWFGGNIFSSWMKILPEDIRVYHHCIMASPNPILKQGLLSSIIIHPLLL